MKEMQFTAMVMMSMLALTLILLLPRRAVRDRVFAQSRWKMAAALALLAVQFLLQYVFGFREMGVTQAVTVNLLFFIPASVLLTMAVRGLQLQGRQTWREWMPGVAAYGVTVVAIGTAALMTGDMLADTAAMHGAVYGGGVAYLAMQLVYAWCIKKGNDRLDEVLKNYYDRYMGDLLDWMRQAVNLLALIALAAPVLIFSSGLPLLAYAMMIFFSIFYLVIRFICYGVAGDSRSVQAAEENAEETTKAESASSFSDEDRDRVARAVERWTARGGHLHSGITMPVTAGEIGVPRYLLAAWLKTTEQQLFNPWLTHLRIEEAKRQLHEHPDWQLETIAERCGFASRSYFQTVFKKHTGLSPTEFIGQQTDTAGRISQGE